MSFNNIAINDSCMARVELTGNLVAGFDCCQILYTFLFYGEAMFLKVRAPIATAASGWRFKNGYNPRFAGSSGGYFSHLLVAGYDACQQRQQDCK